MGESKMTDNGGFFEGLSEIIAGAGVPLLLSLGASAVRFVKSGWRGCRHFAASLLTSIFVGQVVFWGLDYFHWSPQVQAAIVSLSAYMGGSLLDALVFRVKHEIRDGGAISAKMGGGE